MKPEQEERPIWISETYSQPVSIGSVTMMAHRWVALAQGSTERRSLCDVCEGRGCAREGFERCHLCRGTGLYPPKD